MQVLELALTQTSSSSSVQWSTDDDDALRPELRLELWTLVVGGRFVVVVVAVRAVVAAVVGVATAAPARKQYSF